MKKVLALALILLFLLPAQVFAHSKLTVSTPEKNATLETSPALISMEFNTDIAAVSTFVLENEQGIAVEVADINVEGAKLYGTPVHTLDNGSYQVKWTIIGADGHTVEGDFSFKVNAPEVAAQPTEDEPETPETTEEPAATDASEATPEPTPQSTPVAAEQTTETEKSSMIMPIIIVGVIIVLAALFATKRTKK